jgi:CBS domain containing-hemolysin-like protein
VTSLSMGWALALASLLLALHVISVALAKALRTYSRSRLEELCEHRGRGQRADEIARMDERTERAVEALAALTGLGLAAMLGATAGRVAPNLEAESVAAIALVIGALGHLFAGVIGRVHAEEVLDRLWPFADWIRRLMTPFTWTTRLAEALSYRRWRPTAPAPRPPSVEVEIHSVSDRPADDVEADLPESTRAMLERVVELSQRDVAEIMTPRSAMLLLPATISAREAAHTISESGFSRIPLYGENRDDIVGLLYAKDLFAQMTEGDDPDAVVPRKLARPGLFVPESKNAQELLEEFRARRVQMAIVLDEYGGVSGMVTLEDLIEELVGPIDDEHDKPTPADPVVPLGGSRYEVDATMPLESLNERLGLHLPTDGDFVTVGGLAFDALGRVPEPGAVFLRNGVEFTVLEVAEHSIRRLRLDLQPSQHPVAGKAH